MLVARMQLALSARDKYYRIDHAIKKIIGNEVDYMLQLNINFLNRVI